METRDKGSGKNQTGRRGFLKRAGLGAAALGVASTAPRLVKPAFAAKRDYILIGQPGALTGPLAGFGEITPWMNPRVLAEINKDGGIYIKDQGKKMPVKVKLLDTESNPTKAAEMASKLIKGDKVDLICVDHAPTTVDPVTSICENFKVPAIAVNSPLESFIASLPHTWAFLSFWTVTKDIMPVFTGMWEQIPTNKVVGLLFVSDPGAVPWSKVFNKVLPDMGYKVVDPGLFTPGLTDFSAYITAWKNANVEILTGNLAPPDFATCWRQCARMDFRPKIATIGRAILFPSAVEALGGDLGNGLTTELWWSPYHPYKSSINGMSPRELCDIYMESSGKQWTPPLGYSYALYEIASDVLKRAATLDKDKIRLAAAETDLNTIVGPIKYNKDNYCRTPVVGGQWVKGKKYPWDIEIVYNKEHPEVPITAKQFPLK